MPSSINKNKIKEKSSILEIIKDQEIIRRKILDENYNNPTRLETISNEIEFSSEDKKLCFTISDKINFEKDSLSNYKVKMYQ